MITLFSNAYANEAVTTNPLSGFIPLILIFTIFYFLIIRPQQKKIKEHPNMINNLKKGDVIVTSGGIYGKISKIKDDIIDLDIAKEVTVKVAKATVSNKSGQEIKIFPEDKTKKNNIKKK